MSTSSFKKQNEQVHCMKRSKSVRNINIDFQSCIDGSAASKSIILKPSILEGISISRSTSIESTSSSSSSSSSSIVKDLFTLSPPLSSTTVPTLQNPSVSNKDQQTITSSTAEGNDYDTSFWDADDDQDFCCPSTLPGGFFSSGSGVHVNRVPPSLNTSKQGAPDPLVVHISPRRLVVMTKWATERRMSLDEVVHLSFQIPPSYRKDSMSTNDSKSYSSSSSPSGSDSGSDGGNGNNNNTDTNNNYYDNMEQKVQSCSSKKRSSSEKSD